MTADSVLARHGVRFVLDTRAKFRTGDTTGNIVTTKWPSRGASQDIDALVRRPDVPYAYVAAHGAVVVLRQSGSSEIVVAESGDVDAQAAPIAALTAALVEQGATVAEEPKPKRKNRKTEPEPETVIDDTVTGDTVTGDTDGDAELSTWQTLRSSWIMDGEDPLA